ARPGRSHGDPPRGALCWPPCRRRARAARHGEGAVSIEDLISQMQHIEEELVAADDMRAAFHRTYLRTTQAVARALRDGAFADPGVLARREADHRQIDEVLAARVGAEDEELKHLETPRSLQDTLLQPLNRMSTRRLLRESRAKVWANAIILNQARRHGPG